jgi:hypothetical protein
MAAMSQLTRAGGDPIQGAREARLDVTGSDGLGCSVRLLR